MRMGRKRQHRILEKILVWILIMSMSNVVVATEISTEPASEASVTTQAAGTSEVETVTNEATTEMTSEAVKEPQQKKEEIELPQGLKEKGSAAVKLLVYAQDDGGNRYIVKQGTGILVGIQGNSNANEQIVLTSDKLVHVNETELNNIRLINGLAEETGLEILVELVLQVGTKVSLAEGSSGDDFVVMNLSTPINVEQSFNLGKSSEVYENDKLYMMGYGGRKDILGQEQISNTELEFHTGVVTSVSPDVIVTDYQPQAGNIGMPVLDANGYVVGMFVETEEGLVIRPIDKIKQVLDVLNISYLGTDESNHYNEVTPEIQQAYEKLLGECQELAMQKDVYSKKSIGKLKEAINKAAELTGSTSPTYDDYEKAIEELNKGKKKLKKLDHTIHMVQIGLAVAILFFVFLCLRTQFIIKRLQEDNKYNLGVASGKNEVVYAKLIRLDTMEEISITNVIFRIGKHTDDSEYVIHNNSSISRHHADIMRKGNQFFIQDNNSTNHTFVNGEQIVAGQYVPIKGGDRIRLADVEFRFEI